MVTLKTPEAPATKKQLWLLHILTKTDTRNLDITMQEASNRIAELKNGKHKPSHLTTTFNRDVEIRFNSDRESGGAWLKNSLKGFAGNCQVGLGAGIRAVQPDGMSREDWVHNSTREFRNSQPKELYIDTYVKQSALKDPSLANSGTENSHYYFLHHKSVDEALAWLIANVDREKILD